MEENCFWKRRVNLGYWVRYFDYRVLYKDVRAGWNRIAFADDNGLCQGALRSHEWVRSFVSWWDSVEQATPYLEVRCLRSLIHTSWSPMQPRRISAYIPRFHSRPMPSSLVWAYITTHTYSLACTPYVLWREGSANATYQVRLLSDPLGIGKNNIHTR